MSTRWIKIVGGAGLAAGAVAVSYPILFRGKCLNWGARPDEISRQLPGDDLLTDADIVATRAITIDAPRSDIWPWLVQVGYGRAGFYSYDLLDNLGRRSADRIIPEFQDLEVGTWIPMAPGPPTTETAFRVRAFEPNRWLLWDKTASTWSWLLQPIDENHTRLVSRVRCRYRWSRPTIVADLLLMEIADFFMMRKMLLDIRARAERSGRQRESG